MRGSQDPMPGSRQTRRRSGTQTGNAETRRRIRKYVAAGGEIRKASGRSPHPKLYYRGQYVCTICLTPSDHRSVRNELAAARRAGMEI